MKPTSRFLVVGALVAAVALVAACNGSTGGLGSVPSVAPTPSSGPIGPDLTPAPSDGASPSTAPSDAPESTPNPSATPGQTATPPASPAGTMIVRAYFVLGGEPGTVGLVPVLREVPKTTAVATTAMKSLLAGPTSKESSDRSITSAIPDGTRLLGLSVKNGVATVDLSTEYDSGGGTTSMQYRLAQVVYTLTQFSTVKSVVFQIEGETVTVFGGEGIVLDGPQARADYYDQLPSIFVDRPAFGAAFASGGHVAGNANVFEATFRVAVLDASGKSLVDRQVMATCGSGCRGTFDVTLQYKVSKGQWGTLHAYNPSAKDGTPGEIRDYPVWLTPGG
jgi:sporulation and spore germination protein/immunoglobulin-like protein involved in spore germination